MRIATLTTAAMIAFAANSLLCRLALGAGAVDAPSAFRARFRSRPAEAGRGREREASERPEAGKLVVAVVAAALLVATAAGCARRQGPAAPAPPQPTDCLAPGTHDPRVERATLDLPGCSLEYLLYRPGGRDDAPLVVLGHGFWRSAERMAGLARHMASHGLRVATLSFCHSNPLDADHRQNGLDAAALAARLARKTSVVHAGFSAGGAAAFIAANVDPAALGVIGLDAVDAYSVAERAAEDVAEGVPGVSSGARRLEVLGLLAAASPCNARNNGLAIYRRLRVAPVRVVDATHCDFESPTDLLCTAVCSSQEISRAAVVAALTTAFATHVTGLDPGAPDWLPPDGRIFRRFVEEGVLEPVPRTEGTGSGR